MELYIFLSLLHASPLPLNPLPWSLWSPRSQFTQEILSFFFYFPCRYDLCKSLLESSLLSKFYGIVICRLIFFGRQLLSFACNTVSSFPLRARTLSGLKLNRYCVYCHSLCEFMCISPVIILRYSFLELCFISRSHNL